MRILNDRGLPRRPRRTSSDNDCIKEVFGTANAAKLVKLLRSARVTSCTGDTGRNGMYHAAPGLIFLAPQGLSVIFSAQLDWFLDAATAHKVATGCFRTPFQAPRSMIVSPS